MCIKKVIWSILISCWLKDNQQRQLVILDANKQKLYSQSNLLIIFVTMKKYMVINTGQWRDAGNRDNPTPTWDEQDWTRRHTGNDKAVQQSAYIKHAPSGTLWWRWLGMIKIRLIFESSKKSFILYLPQG